MKKLINILKRYFVSGMLVVVPLILTYIVLKFLFESIDDILRPAIEQLFGFYIYGLGVLSTILIILISGLLTRNIIGARLYRFWDRFLEKVPIIRPIYSAAKQLLESITMPSMDSFKEVVMIEYPRKGVYALGFLSNRMIIDKDQSKDKYASVFVPSTPTPISGMVILFLENDIFPLDMTVEEGIKFLVSGGVVSPDTLFVKRKKDSEDKS
jgi:uncharacterized membrane protein